MSSTYLSVFIHFVWSTYKRQKLIDDDLESIIKGLFMDKIIEHKCKLIAFGCSKDHIHLLVSIHPLVCISSLVKEVKGYSSYMISNKIRAGSNFRWQGGYGAMSVSQADLPFVKAYIRNQKKHHGSKLQTFP